MQRDSVFGWWSRWLSRRGLRRRFGLGPGTENCIKMSEGCYASSVSECVAAVSADQKLSRLYLLYSSFLFQIVPVLSTLSVLSFPVLSVQRWVYLSRMCSFCRPIGRAHPCGTVSAPERFLQTHLCTRPDRTLLNHPSTRLNQPWLSQCFRDSDRNEVA